MRYLTIILTIISLPLFSQSSQRCKWVSSFDQQFFLDSLSIVPGSFSFSQRATIDYDINANSIRIIPESNTDSLEICYSVFPMLLTASHSNRTRDVAGTEKKSKLELSNSQPVLKRNSLIKSGIISRGASVGNTRDMAINSRMDLKVAGEISDNLNLEATIFDQNVPYQPEGNTNSLKNFDRLHINLFNDEFALEAGDIYLNGERSPFLKYSRGIMGAGISVMDSTQRVKIMTGINKGRFHSYSFFGTDGVSGPYRISGPVNDPFVIVLAGSDKVYLDGNQLRRGVEEDYEIDYNLGEITFTNRNIISRYSRIRIDFEYMNRTYQRSTKVVEYELNKSKFNAFLSYYGEKDNPSIVSGINPDELSAMKGIEGGELTSLSIQLVDYQEAIVSYVLTDSLGYSDVLVYSNNRDLEHFSAKFSYSGEKKGNYVRDYQHINQVVFEWVEPINGEPQGDYSPFKKNKAPGRKDIVSAGIDIKLNKFERVFSEVALSSSMLNLFSDSNPENGWALKSGLESEGRPLNAKSEYKWKYGIRGQWIDQNFKMVDPIHPIEFNRNWGVVNGLVPASDRILDGYASLTHNERGSFNWNGQWRNRGVAVDGYDQKLSISQNLKHLKLDAKIGRMRNRTSIINSEWNNVSFNVSYPGKLVRPGYFFNSDKNLSFTPSGGTLLSSLQNFEEHRWFVSNGSESGIVFNSYYGIREDFRPQSGELKPVSRSETVHLNISRVIGKGTIETGITHREMKDVNSSSSVLLGNIKGNLQLLRGAVRSTFRGETSSGWEPKREFIYSEVPIGQGHYAWRDLNDDGIQQLGEFFEAIHFDERNYVRFYVTSPERIPAYSSNLYATVRLRWPNTGKKSSWLNKVSAILRFSSVGKTKNSDARLSVLSTSLLSNEVLSGKRRSMIRIKAVELWDIISVEVGVNKTENKNWVMDGFEMRNNSSLDANLGLKMGRGLTWSFSGLNEAKKSGSNVLLGRNYSFDRQVVSNSWNWNPKPGVSFESKYKYIKSEGIGDDEIVQSKIHLIKLSTQLKALEKSILRNEIEWANVDYTGNPNSALGYDLMDAFLPGHNIRWTASFQQELKSGLFLNLMYIGRKSPTRGLINRASLQVSARF